MQMMLMAAEAIVEAGGSLMIAGLICWLLWNGFKCAHHPAWAMWAVVLAWALAVLGTLPHSEFLDMALAFAAVGAIPLWIEGRAWRKRYQKQRMNAQMSHARLAAIASSAGQILSPPRLYPAMTACISEQRSPTKGEIRLVATRLWREGLALHSGSPSSPVPFGMRRALWRASVASLRGGS
jgi:hypothetical protein